METVLGIIGGSGLYNIAVLKEAQWVHIDSPWGEPSDAVKIGYANDLKVVFMPRHGRGHVHSPSSINYRANIDVMKRAGVTDLISISAVGSLKEELDPGTFVLVDQFIDRTINREKSFFGKGCVAHVSVADPVSPKLLDLVEDVCQKQALRYSRGGTYLAMEGPQFSSLAESLMYRQWGCDVIGMTNMPEAKLAREAEIAYASIAMVTDYDSWHPAHGSVDINSIIQVLHDNVAHAQALVDGVVNSISRLFVPCPIGSELALDFAIMTAEEKRCPELLAKLDAVAGRVL
ncbi:S-methyl-5'-thioadenosine phosphorylase [Polycladidibacter stylochi]|uniref:S-methyl-5'-thioadenosine phosphorylase n=1 Tax=Polycladidibacter stylochi TaxID=1807766 RepID=UPI00082C369A|nr:S-methyl-5'-thioadenosine phosphorylase [Pseudovibrio stylochi]